ncbi:MAG: M24 family metallopeptidase [Candidatus Heimdallarchaeota archaeon]
MSAEKIIQKLRGRKSKTEIELITKSCEMTKGIYERIGSQIKVGMVETEVQKMFHDEVAKLGVVTAWQAHSCPAVDAGPDKEIGHAGPKSDIKIKAGHTLHYDFGVKLHGYCSDIQRMYFFGKEEDIPEELIHAFETVHGAITRAAEFIKPGVKGFEVDKIARDYVIERGPKGVVEENMIYTLELNVKTKNYGYVSIEEDIVVTKEGCKFLIPRQEKFITID